MARYTRETRVAAPLSDVRAFHSRPEGLVTLTPGFLNLAVEATRGPAGEPDPETLAVGSEVDVSIRPFGVGPRQRWTSRIVEREVGDDAARIVDEMVEGPLQRWVHVHRFVADGDGTIVRDEVDWALPGGPLGEGLATVGVVGLAPVFRHRHRRTKALLED